jgi:diguanylate cyclase (GGDEF)-like protein
VGVGADPPAREDVARRLAPFAAAAILGFALVGLTARPDPGRFAAAAATCAGVVALTALVPWARLPRDFRMLPPLLFLLSAWLLRDAGGGTAAGVGALALLPVFWSALHGTRRELMVVLAGVAAYYALPILLVGGAAYPAYGYRTGALFLAISGIVGLTVQHLVAQVRGHVEDLERHRADFQRVAEASRRMATSADARADVCRAACDVSGATFVALLEPDGTGGLVSTAMAGLEARPIVSAPAAERPPTLQAFHGGKAVFIADAATHEPFNRELWREHGSPASMLFQPVQHGDRAAGVLLVGWAERVVDARRPAIVSLLAEEAAIAIERVDVVEELAGLAATDALTGAPNRRAWDAHLDHASRAAAGRPFAVAMLDLDHFKAFNDAHGHQAGDRLLKEAAAAWRAALRPGDVLARYGGEEFALLLHDCDLRLAQAITERLRAATPGRETCSAGVARWDGAESVDALVGRADRALYAAKAAGRDRTVADHPRLAAAG